MDLSNKPGPTVERKNQHLRIVIEEDVEYRCSTLLEDLNLLHNALPELDFDQIDLKTTFFGKQLRAPLMITSMTGGAEFAEKMNHGLAEVAQIQGIAFAVGSQRVMLHHPEVTAHFAVRESIPDGVLLGNIGAVQLEEYPLATISGLVDQIEADGICVHLNPAQEMMQREGHRNFNGLLEDIARLNDHLQGRVLVKETGSGMSPEVIGRLAKLGINYIDIAGAGGTSWTKVESFRANHSLLRTAGNTYAEWGVPTAVSLVAGRRLLSDDTCLIGSGGIRNGLDCAKAIAAGADIVGFARPILLGFIENGVEGASKLIEQYVYELKTAMLLSRAESVPALQDARRIYTGNLLTWLTQLGLIEGENSKS